MLNGDDGIAAEEYFLHAASLALGLDIIFDASDESPGTIRKTVENTEESEKTDFILILRDGARVPVEITLISRKNRYDKTHMEKKRNHKNGEVLLFWPVNKLAKEIREITGEIDPETESEQAQEASLQWLREAAEGGYEALTSFRHWLNESIREFLERQASN